MSETQKLAVLKILRKMRIALPNGSPDLDNKDVAQTWVELLEDIPIEVLLKAAQDAIFAYDFFPSIAKLRGAAKDFGHNPAQAEMTLLDGEVKVSASKIKPKMSYIEQWATMDWSNCNYLLIELPEPQCFEKQHIHNAISEHSKKIDAAGYRVTNVQVNAGAKQTENGRSEPNITYKAIIQVIKPKVTKYEDDY
jgi:hypothetical protein